MIVGCNEILFDLQVQLRTNRPNCRCHKHIQVIYIYIYIVQIWLQLGRIPVLFCQRDQMSRIVDYLLIAVHAFSMITPLSVDKMLLAGYRKWYTNFRGLLFNVESTSSSLKQMTWTLTKHLEKKVNCNYTRILCNVFNKIWKQTPTKQQLYGHLPPISQTIPARYAGHFRRNKDKVMGSFPVDSHTWTY